MNSVVQAAALEWWGTAHGNGKEEGRASSKNATFLSLGINSGCTVQSAADIEQKWAVKQEFPGHTRAPVLLAYAGKSSQTATVSENEMNPLSITDTSNADTVRDDKAWGQLLAIPEAIYSHGRRTWLRFFMAQHPEIVVTASLLICSYCWRPIRHHLLSQVLTWSLQDYCWATRGSSVATDACALYWQRYSIERLQLFPNINLLRQQVL